MCGIAGIVGMAPDYVPDPELLGRMTRALAHRGPDHEGLRLLRQAALGHRRLSVIDTSPAGNQPMSNEDGSVWIAYNGECYNFRELRARLEARGHVFRSRTDTEALIHLYEERGEEMAAEIEGIFAFAVWDCRQRRLLLVRDRLGVKPLYYHLDSARLLFGSELKALLCDTSIPRALDPAALAEYLHFMSVIGPQSIIRNVRRLPAGHVLTLAGGECRLRRYWDVTACGDFPGGPSEAAVAVREKLEAAVARQLVSDVPLGAFLSGGVDSSAVCAFASRRCTGKLKTFSVAFTGEEYDESDYAALVGRHCGSEHSAFLLDPAFAEKLPEIVWHADEPFAVSSACALYLLAAETAKRVKVALSGDGADELFAGYPWRHRRLPLDRRAAWLLRNWNRCGALPFLGGGLGESLPAWKRRRSALYAAELCMVQPFENFRLLSGDLRGAAMAAARDNPIERAYFDCPSREELARKLYADLHTTLASEMLTKVDRMTMAHGLEARVPFLDTELVELAFSLPGRLKFAGGEGKLALRDALAETLPEAILLRPKHGFNVPLKPWLRGELKEMILDLLGENAVRRRGFFEPAAVAATLEEHFSGAVNRGNHIFVMLMLELWCRRFLDGKTA